MRLTKFSELVVYTQKLNQQLRDNLELEARDRVLLTAGVLVALKSAYFRDAYPHICSQSKLAEFIVESVESQFVSSGVGEPEREAMSQIFSFMRTNTKLARPVENTYLKSFVEEIQNVLLPFSESNRQYDILGRMYLSSLKHTSGDSGLGIVLTPQHITELFVELAEIDERSVVVDICCGSGGFLVSAIGSQSSAGKVVGVESNTTMLTLACSNMILRNIDGCSIRFGNCFQIGDTLVEKPDVALLNPPYSKAGHNEFEFVRKSLELLSRGGKCVALLPRSCAMNSDRESLRLKIEILKTHTLKAVMSMPSELFADSKKSVETCAMVFEAHKPHQTGTLTWFGDWKNDGFKKTRKLGRADVDGKYAGGIKNVWLRDYKNLASLSQSSVLEEVTAEDEWLVEAYSETDFLSLKDRDFENTMLRYTGFLFSNSLTSVASSKSLSAERKNLDFTDWRPVRLGDILEVSGTRTTAKKLLASDTAGLTPYVSTQSTNNGVRFWCDGDPTEPGNVLTIDSAVAGFCSYQPLPFLASDHVEKLSAKNFLLTPEVAMFLVTIINMEAHRYSYGRKANQHRIANTVISVPFKNSEPDWEGITDYIRGLPYSKYLTLTNR